MSRLGDAFRGALGLPTAEEARTLTSDTLWGDQIPFNYGGSLGSGNMASVGQDKALSLGPVYSAVRVLADNISTLPMKGYRKLGDDRVPMSKLPPLFESMNEAGELVPWLYRCVTSVAIRGNAYGLTVARDGYEYPTQVEWLDPSAVAPDDRPNSRGGWLVNGRPVSREDLVHVTRFPLAGQRVGLSPIGSFASTLGIALSAQSYTADWFDAGGFPPGTFKNEEKTVSQQEAAIIKARLTSAIRTREPVVYGKDWTYNPITVPPEEAQFIGTMRLTANQIAAIFGIIQPEWLGGESGSSNTYANVEQAQTQFVMLTLRPWLVILEHAFSALLPRGQYVKFNSDALVRADLRTRWDVSKIRVELGAASVNEIRAQEDQEPIPGGNEYKAATATPPAANPGQGQTDQEQDPTPPGVTPIRRTA
jgi:HK97 family phage portal protein